MKNHRTYVSLLLSLSVPGIFGFPIWPDSSHAEPTLVAQFTKHPAPDHLDMAPHWDYLGVEGPAHWGLLTPEYMTCETGRQQSPINITMAQHNDHPEELTFQYQTSELHQLNKGHTIQVSHASGCRVDLNHQPYKLRQFHFHEPSEHHIDGKAYPMEMHLVHQDTRGHTLVIAVMMAVGRDEPVFDKLWKWLPDQVGRDVPVPVDIRLGDLLPTDTHHFSYSGSLTTPPCTEGVRWIVLENPMSIAQADIDQFVRIIGHNARPIQPAHRRSIEEN